MWLLLTGWKIGGQIRNEFSLKLDWSLKTKSRIQLLIKLKPPRLFSILCVVKFLTSKVEQLSCHSDHLRVTELTSTQIVGWITSYARSQCEVLDRWHTWQLIALNFHALYEITVSKARIHTPLILLFVAVQHFRASNVLQQLVHIYKSDRQQQQLSISWSYSRSPCRHCSSRTNDSGGKWFHFGGNLEESVSQDSFLCSSCWISIYWPIHWTTEPATLCCC